MADGHIAPAKPCAQEAHARIILCVDCGAHIPPATGPGRPRRRCERCSRRQARGPVAKCCLVCGSTFTAVQDRARFCSQKCRSDWFHERAPSREFRCAECGRGFLTQQSKATYCSTACMAASLSRRNLALMGRPERQCGHCGQTFRPKWNYSAKQLRGQHKAGVYCSRSCAQAARKKSAEPKPVTSCRICGKPEPATTAVFL